uniref:Calmodulin-lysine N-methyltransferase n=1 Tax=Odontella aurita TaxID=265563 RepID=A0A6U6GS73_9STRA|mmetsp:Transcript_43590/g.132670  ORF Transcript_43590/g.132670 Transcript_43590/m.132670 type:complete len:276 (+) Transcript_43590:35-862(+)
MLLRTPMILPLLPSGAALKLARSDGVLGGRIWPAAVALCEYLVSVKQTHALECVELGSGTGAVGLFAAAMGYAVTVTEHRPALTSARPPVTAAADGTPEDLDMERSDQLLSLLQTNVDENLHLFEHLPRVLELDWTDTHQVQHVAASSESHDKGFDLILASDVTYISQFHQPLADTIACLLHQDISRDSCDSRAERATMRSKCLLSHQERLLNLRGSDSQLDGFEQALMKAGLSSVCKEVYSFLEGSTTHQVSILEIQHKQVCRPGELRSGLWVP